MAAKLRDNATSNMAANTKSMINKVLNIFSKKT